MPAKRIPYFCIATALVLAVILWGLLAPREPQYHPYVVVQATESLRITFLQRALRSANQCRATVKRVADAMLAQCSTCRLLENHCLDKLDPRQRKILSGQALDIPVARTFGGVVAFQSSMPELAQQVCRETERHASSEVPTQCRSAGADGIALSLAKVGDRKDAATIPQWNALLALTLLAAAVSLLACYLLIRSEHLHGRFSHDATEGGPQKFHASPTLRVGGVAIAAALAVSVLTIEALDWIDPVSSYGLTMLALCAVPAFAGGFSEDVSKRIGALARLLLTFSAGVFASLLVGATLDRIDVPGFDTLLQWPVFAIAFTAFAVAGITNATNIIDGYNGLAGGYGVIVFGALAWVAWQVGDPVVLAASLAMLGTLLGFLLWNYPKGMIFLGDGGAYLLGFWLAELSVLLVVRNPDVSPWFPLLLLSYPIIETMFSIYRKMNLRELSPGQPDGLHMHMMIYKRLVRIGVTSRNPEDVTRRNSMVAIYVWAGTAMFILPSLFVWRSSAWLIALSILFLIAYVWLYSRLMQWRAPSWMIISPKIRES